MSKEDTKTDRKEWTVAIASRTLKGTDGCSAKLVGYLTCSNITHVELLILVECKGDECPYRIEDNPKIKAEPGITKIKHKVGRQHILGFSARTNAVEKNVVCYLDPRYPGKSAWEYTPLTMTDNQRKRLLEFALEHTGDGYSHECCYCCNGCCWMCIRWCGETPCGVTTRQIREQDGKVEARKWFCSEFIVAALVASGYEVGALEPSVSTPANIRDLAFSASKCSLTHEQATASRWLTKGAAPAMSRNEEAPLLKIDK